VVFRCDLTLPPQQRLAERIRELRLDAEFTQAEVARRTGIHRPIVGRIERGLHLLSIETLTRVAVALEIDVETICVVLDDEWTRGAIAYEKALKFASPYSRVL